MSLVDIVDVRKSFGPTEVLKGVSVGIERGDVVAIIGRSGSGKSTLLRCINGLETYHSGAITVDGIDVGEARKKESCAICAAMSAWCSSNSICSRISPRPRTSCWRRRW